MRHKIYRGTAHEAHLMQYTDRSPHHAEYENGRMVIHLTILAQPAVLDKLRNNVHFDHGDTAYCLKHTHSC